MRSMSRMSPSRWKWPPAWTKDRRSRNRSEPAAGAESGHDDVAKRSPVRKAVVENRHATVAHDEVWCAYQAGAESQARAESGKTWRRSSRIEFSRYYGVVPMASPPRRSPDGWMRRPATSALG